MTVTSEGGVGASYTINITRTPSADTTLTEATITVTSTESSGSSTPIHCYFADSTDGKSCSFDVPTSTTAFRLGLTGGALDAGSTDPVVPKDYEMPASQSTIEIPITVTAENGNDTDTYTVTVNRAKSGNNNLVDISYKVDENAETWTKVNNFVPGTNLYRVEVDGIYNDIFTQEVNRTR